MFFTSTFLWHNVFPVDLTGPGRTAATRPPQACREEARDGASPRPGGRGASARGPSACGALWSLLRTLQGPPLLACPGACAPLDTALAVPTSGRPDPSARRPLVCTGRLPRPPPHLPATRVHGTVSPAYVPVYGGKERVALDLLHSVTAGTCDEDKAAREQQHDGVGSRQTPSPREAQVRDDPARALPGRQLREPLRRESLRKWIGAWVTRQTSAVVPAAVS